MANTNDTDKDKVKDSNNTIEVRSNSIDFSKIFDPYKYLNELDEEESFLYEVRCVDGYCETFTVTKVRISSYLLSIKLESGEERKIPLFNVRWCGKINTDLKN